MIKNRGISLLLIALVYAAAFGLGAGILSIMAPFLRPLWALFTANAAATVLVFRAPLIKLTLISGALLFFSFSYGKLRKIIIK